MCSVCRDADQARTQIICWKCRRKKPFLSQRRAGNKVPAAFLNYSILKVPSLFHYKIILSEARGVTMWLWWHWSSSSTEHISRGSFPLRGEVGRSLRGSDNYYLKYFSRHLTPAVLVSRVTWHVWHAAPAIIIVMQSVSWYPHSDHSYLNFVGNYPRGTEILSVYTRVIINN